MEESGGSLQPLEICENEVSLVAWQPSWCWSIACVAYSCFSCLQQKISLMDGGLKTILFRAPAWLSRLKSILFNTSGWWKSWTKIKLLTFSCTSLETEEVKLLHPGESKQAELVVATGKSSAQHHWHDSPFCILQWWLRRDSARQRNRQAQVP